MLDAAIAPDIDQPYQLSMSSFEYALLYYRTVHVLWRDTCTFARSDWAGCGVFFGVETRYRLLIVDSYTLFVVPVTPLTTTLFVMMSLFT